MKRIFTSSLYRIVIICSDGERLSRTFALLASSSIFEIISFTTLKFTSASKRDTLISLRANFMSSSESLPLLLNFLNTLLRLSFKLSKIANLHYAIFESSSRVCRAWSIFFFSSGFEVSFNELRMPSICKIN